MEEEEEEEVCLRRRGTDLSLLQLFVFLSVNVTTVVHSVYIYHFTYANDMCVYCCLDEQNRNLRSHMERDTR